MTLTKFPCLWPFQHRLLCWFPPSSTLTEVSVVTLTSCWPHLAPYLLRHICILTSPDLIPLYSSPMKSDLTHPIPYLNVWLSCHIYTSYKKLLPFWSSLSQLRAPLTLNHPTSSSHYLSLIIKNKIKKSYSYNYTCKIVFFPLSCRACCYPGLYIIILAPRNPVFLQSNLRASSMMHLLAMITLSSAWGPLVTWRSHYGKA